MEWMRSSGDSRDHLGQLNRLRDVVDEVDQHREVDHQQRLGHRRREVRHEGRAGTVDGHQSEHRVHEGADEDAQRDLVADVADEVPHHAGSELLRRQRQRQDGDGEHHADDGDHRGRDGDQDLALGVGTARPDPARQRQVLVEGGEVDLERDEEQQRPRPRSECSEPPTTSSAAPPSANSAAVGGPCRHAPARASPAPRRRSRRDRRSDRTRRGALREGDGGGGCHGHGFTRRRPVFPAPRAAARPATASSS